MKILLIALFASICFIGCKKEEDKPQNAVITITNERRDSAVTVKIYAQFGYPDLDTVRLRIGSKETIQTIWKGGNKKGEGGLTMTVVEPLNKRYGVAYFTAGRFGHPPYNRFVFSIYKDSVLSKGTVLTPIPNVRAQ